MTGLMTLLCVDLAPRLGVGQVASVASAQNGVGFRLSDFRA